MERIEIEPCSKITVLRKTYEGDALVRAEVLHHGRRKGWRLCPYRYDPLDSLAYMSSDGLAAYIHAHGEVGFYDAWSDGERSSRKISREAWIDECLADMRHDAELLQPKKKPRKGELIVDRAHLSDVEDEYFRLQRVVEAAWTAKQYAAHREDAARCYVLENALAFLTSRFDPCDPKRARIGDERYIWSFGLWAILSFQTRTEHFEEAERLLAQEIADVGRMQLRLDARREQTESALVAGLLIFAENPDRAAMRRARPIAKAIRALVGVPITETLATQLAWWR